MKRARDFFVFRYIHPKAEPECAHPKDFRVSLYRDETDPGWSWWCYLCGTLCHHGTMMIPRGTYPYWMADRLKEEQK